MRTLSEVEIADLLRPYRVAEPRTDVGLTVCPEQVLHAQLARYLDLLLRWNARTNLTAVRDPEGIVVTHFGESLFAAYVLSAHLQDGKHVLDLGTGAGFPGIPMQLLFPKVMVTLAESQSKKVAFLREAVRALGLPSIVWGKRVESLPPEVCFEAVTLRAVDRMSEMTQLGWQKVTQGGVLLEMTISSAATGEEHRIPGTRDRVVALRPKS